MARTPEELEKQLDDLAAELKATKDKLGVQFTPDEVKGLKDHAAELQRKFDELHLKYAELQEGIIPKPKEGHHCFWCR